MYVKYRKTRQKTRCVRSSIARAGAAFIITNSVPSHGIWAPKLQHVRKQIEKITKQLEELNKKVDYIKKQLEE